MTLDAAAEAEAGLAEQSPPAAPRRLHDAPRSRLSSAGFAAAGVVALCFLWWLGGWLIAHNPNTTSFAGFAPLPALQSLIAMVGSGEAWRITAPSLWRVGLGLFWATALGVPLGILIGRSGIARQITNVPFQFLRMISPLSWMPIAILAFSTWEGAIIFLIAVAAVWPVLFSTAAGVRRIDPAWFKVARNLGANAFHLLTAVILPAIAQDILTGIRLALGVAWIVLVPAEYLGVKSGLGYAINDARDTLEYDRLAAIVLIVGLIGFALDAGLQQLIRRFSWLRQESG
ncbi:MAG TPA: ABC transporter permease [Rhodomicrobium sp.]|nr:ABC transporter permease [Rhodomicrobium sp.]